MASDSEPQAHLRPHPVEHGRPLSIIESVGSGPSEVVSDYEGDGSVENVVDTDLSYDHPEARSKTPQISQIADMSTSSTASQLSYADTSVMSSSTDVPMGRKRSFQELQVQVNDLFDRFANVDDSGISISSSSATESSSASEIEDGTISSNLPIRRRRRRKPNRFVLTGDLPAMLAEWESLRKEPNPISAYSSSRQPLIDPALMPQIEAFARDNPTVRFEPAMLVKMIVDLQEAYSEATANVSSSFRNNSLSGDEIVDVQRILSDSSNLSGIESSSDDESSDSGPLLGEFLSRDDREETPTPGGRDATISFPSSGNERSSSDEDIGKDYSASVSRLKHKRRSSQDLNATHRKASRDRERKTSASTRTGVSSGEGSQPRSRKSSAGMPAEEKEILRGKGKAKPPPSAWSRPKPKAIAQSRARRTSETSSETTSSPSTATFAEDGIGLGRPSQPRSRQASQPVTMGAPGTPGTPEERFARSVSTGFVFPRAHAAEQADLEMEDDRRFEQWSSALSGQQNAQSGSDTGSRGGSPPIDESSYTTFSTLSPSGSAHATLLETPLRPHGPGIPRGVSSPDVYGLTSPTVARSAALQYGDLVRENDRLRREKKELQDSMSTKEDEFESVTADLHARLEKTEEALNIARREEREASLTVTQHAEQIASLEAELGAVQRRSKLLEEVNHKSRDKIETQIAEHDLLRKQMDILRGDVKTSKGAEEHAEELSNVAQAETARLKALLAEKEARVISLLSLEADNDRLRQENITLTEELGKLKAELDDRNNKAGSGFAHHAGRSASLLGTPSRRLGAELARSIEPAASPSPSPTKEEYGDLPDTSSSLGDDSFIETVTTRHVSRKGKGKNRVEDLMALARVESGVQTEASEQKAVTEPEPSPAVLVPVSPPTYDEAALEKTIVERLHAGSVDHIAKEIATAWPEYVELAGKLNSRCEVFEALLLARASSVRPATTHTATEPSTAITVASSQENALQAIATVLSNTCKHSSSTFKIHTSAFYMGAIAFVVGALFMRLLMPSEHHYHFGPHTESASAWRQSHSFMIPAGTGIDDLGHGHQSGARDIRGRSIL